MPTARRAPSGDSAAERGSERPSWKEEEEEGERRTGAPLAASREVAAARASEADEEEAPSAGEATTTARPHAAATATLADEEEALLRLVQTRAPVEASIAATVPSPEASRTRLLLLFAEAAAVVGAQTNAAGGAPPDSGRATATLADTRPVTIVFFM